MDAPLCELVPERQHVLVPGGIGHACQDEPLGDGHSLKVRGVGGVQDPVDPGAIKKI